MMMKDILDNSLHLVLMSRGENITFGYVPPPVCDLVLDSSGAGTIDAASSHPLVASLFCSPDTQEMVLTPTTDAIKIVLEGQQLHSETEPVSCPPGSVLTFGNVPFESGFLLVPAVDEFPPTQCGLSSTCIFGERPLHLAPPPEYIDSPECNSWLWLPKGRITPSAPVPPKVKPTAIPQKKTPVNPPVAKGRKVAPPPARGKSLVAGVRRREPMKKPSVAKKKWNDIPNMLMV